MKNRTEDELRAWVEAHSESRVVKEPGAPGKRRVRVLSKEKILQHVQAVVDDAVAKEVARLQRDAAASQQGQSTAAVEEARRLQAEAQTELAKQREAARRYQEQLSSVRESEHALRTKLDEQERRSTNARATIEDFDREIRSLAERVEQGEDAQSLLARKLEQKEIELREAQESLSTRSAELQTARAAAGSEQHDGQLAELLAGQLVGLHEAIAALEARTSGPVPELLAELRGLRGEISDVRRSVLELENQELPPPSPDQGDFQAWVDRLVEQQRAASEEFARRVSASQQECNQVLEGKLSEVTAAVGSVSSGALAAAGASRETMDALLAEITDLRGEVAAMATGRAGFTEEAWSGFVRQVTEKQGESASDVVAAVGQAQRQLQARLEQRLDGVEGSLREFGTRLDARLVGVDAGTLQATADRLAAEQGETRAALRERLAALEGGWQTTELVERLDRIESALQSAAAGSREQTAAALEQCLDGVEGSLREFGTRLDARGEEDSAEQALSSLSAELAAVRQAVQSRPEGIDRATFASELGAMCEALSAVQAEVHARPVGVDAGTLQATADRLAAEQGETRAALRERLAALEGGWQTTELVERLDRIESAMQSAAAGSREQTAAALEQTSATLEQTAATRHALDALKGELAGVQGFGDTLDGKLAEIDSALRSVTAWSSDEESETRRVLGDLKTELAEVKGVLGNFEQSPDALDPQTVESLAGRLTERQQQVLTALEDKLNASHRGLAQSLDDKLQEIEAAMRTVSSGSHEQRSETRDALADLQRELQSLQASVAERLDAQQRGASASDVEAIVSTNHAAWQSGLEGQLDEIETALGSVTSRSIDQGTETRGLLEGMRQELTDVHVALEALEQRAPGAEAFAALESRLGERQEETLRELEGRLRAMEGGWKASLDGKLMQIETALGAVTAASLERPPETEAALGAIVTELHEVRGALGALQRRIEGSDLPTTEVLAQKIAEQHGVASQALEDKLGDAERRVHAALEARLIEIGRVLRTETERMVDDGSDTMQTIKDELLAVKSALGMLGFRPEGSGPAKMGELVEHLAERQHAATEDLERRLYSLEKNLYDKLDRKLVLITRTLNDTVGSCVGEGADALAQLKRELADVRSSITVLA